jgi:hypothetical protein
VIERMRQFYETYRDDLPARGNVADAKTSQDEQPGHRCQTPD